MKKNNKSKEENKERNFNRNFINDLMSSCNYDSKDDDIKSKPIVFSKLDKLK